MLDCVGVPLGREWSASLESFMRIDLIYCLLLRSFSCLQVIVDSYNFFFFSSLFFFLLFSLLVFLIQRHRIICGFWGGQKWTNQHIIVRDCGGKMNSTQTYNETRNNLVIKIIRYIVPYFFSFVALIHSLDMRIRCCFFFLFLLYFFFGTKKNSPEEFNWILMFCSINICAVFSIYDNGVRHIISSFLFSLDGFFSLLWEL